MTLTLNGYIVRFVSIFWICVFTECALVFCFYSPVNLWCALFALPILSAKIIWRQDGMHMKEKKKKKVQEVEGRKKNGRQVQKQLVVLLQQQ